MELMSQSPTMELMSHSSTFLLPKVPSQDRSSLTYALVVLNQSLPKFAPLLWDHAQLHVCSNGGANRCMMKCLCSCLMKMLCMYKPDVIKGDMDSIRIEVLDFYRNLGTRIINESHDQDTTDLYKCVAYIHDLTPNIDISTMSLISGLGGRFDHEIGNINVLCRFSDTRIILLSDDCLIHLLSKNHHHKIYVQSSVQGPHCGRFPVGMPSGSTTTNGLQWNLNDTEMRFGGLISTSNIVKEDMVTVQSDSDLLWTISMKKL